MLLLLNTLFFPVIMIGVGTWMNRMDLSKINPAGWIFKTRFWENNLWIYENIFFIRRWKHLLPDGSKLFGSNFSKAAFKFHDRLYLKRFMEETCRGELTHWIDLIFLPLVLLWNPPWAIFFMFTLGLIGNVPCIIVQRYNRIRIKKIIES